MKIAVDDKVNQKFIPIEITFTIETIEEARLMYHVLNVAKNPGVYETLRKGGYDRKSNGDVAKTFLTPGELDVFEKLAKHITGQGYAV